MGKYFDILAYLMGKQAGGGGGDITVESKSISANGTYTAPAGKAYSPVTVSVPNSYAAGDEGKVVSNGALVAQGSDTVTQNGTVDTTLINSLLVNVSGSSGYGYTKLVEQDFTVNTSSTSATQEGTINASGAYAEVHDNRNKLLYVRLRDKAGPRNGYFLGVDTFYPTESLVARIMYAVKDDGTYTVTSSQYGVYPDASVASTDNIKIYSRYSSALSGIINGEYHVEVYTLDWPDGVSPFATS